MDNLPLLLPWYFCCHREEDQRRRQPGLTEEEEAFYEILTRHPSVAGDFNLIREFVKDVTAAIRKNLQIDWYKKPDANAQMMLSVRSILHRKGVSTEPQEILTELMEQAESRYREWDQSVA